MSHYVKDIYLKIGYGASPIKVKSVVPGKMQERTKPTHSIRYSCMVDSGWRHISKLHKEKTLRQNYTHMWKLTTRNNNFRP